MARIIGIEYQMPIFDETATATVLIPDITYPVSFKLLTEPEPWGDIVRRHSPKSALPSSAISKILEKEGMVSNLPMEEALNG